MDVGAVGALRNVKDAIRAAKLVLEHTEHTFLVGDQATSFALSLGLNGPSDLSTPSSSQNWLNWKENGCQPNFWRNVVPNSNSMCGPYTISTEDLSSKIEFSENREVCIKKIDSSNHDTISMAAIDQVIAGFVLRARAVAYIVAVFLS